MIKKLAALFLSLAASAFGHNYYVAQTGSASLASSTTSSFASVATLNTSGSWNGVAGSTVNGGDTVFLEGTISTPINVQGSGTSGNNIVILFTAGANITAGNFGDGNSSPNNCGAFNIVEQGFITINGDITGNQQGVVQCTSNGTGLATHYSSNGVNLIDSHDILVENLTIKNLYVYVGPSDPNGSGAGVDSAGEDTGYTFDLTVNNCLFHDCYQACYMDYGAGNGSGLYCRNYTFTNNTAYNCNWGFGCGDRQNSSVISGITVSGNAIYNFTNWDTGQTNDFYHHDGIYIWSNENYDDSTVGATTISNNTFGPGWNTGSDDNTTAAIYITDQLTGFAGLNGPFLIYGNVFVQNTNDFATDGMIAIGGVTGTVARIYNNTFLSGGTGCGQLVRLGGANGGTQTFYISNNIFNNPDLAICITYSGSLSVLSSYNLFYGNSVTTSTNAFATSTDGDSSFENLATWQGQGYDVATHIQTGNPSLSGAYVPTTGSAAIATGTPESSYFTTDAAGNTWTTPWGIGAFQFPGGGTTISGFSIYGSGRPL